MRINRKQLLINLFFFIGMQLFAENIYFETEYLKTIPISANNIGVTYYEDSYESFGPEGVIITDTGKLIISTSCLNKSNGLYKILIYENNKELKEDYYEDHLSEVSNQNGFSLSGNGINKIVNDKIYSIDKGQFSRTLRRINGLGKIVYCTDDFLFYDVDEDKLHIYQIQDLKITDEFSIDEYNNFPNTSFSINTNSEKQFLYKNDQKWSVNKGSSIGKYIGKLKSGHNVLKKNESVFEITNAAGNLELVLEISLKENQVYCYGLGNWGEVYLLLSPQLNTSDSTRKSKEGDTAELVVCRNYLKYFGILNDDRIRLRKGPGTDTESLGTYPIKTGFRIIEDSGVKQTIGGVTDTWIKVRLLDGTEGYFFGQYIQNLYDGPGTPLPWPNVADWD